MRVFCVQCKERIGAGRTTYRFCSASCRSSYFADSKRRGRYQFNCTTCGAQFISTARNAKYCKKSCRPTWYKKIPPRVKNCEVCNIEFKASRDNIKLCSEVCRKKAWETRMSKRRPDKDQIKDDYVYLWFKKDEEQFPYYVGKGKLERAWREGSGPIVKIVRDNLTAEGALLVESAIINLLVLLGVELNNGPHDHIKRRDKPPLDNK